MNSKYSSRISQRNHMRFNTVLNGASKSKRMLPICRDRTVFQAYEHMPITILDVEDCLIATTKLNVADRINYSSCVGVNLVNVLKYKDFVDELNKQYYTSNRKNEKKRMFSMISDLFHF